jgi:hypothetical protein
MIDKYQVGNEDEARAVEAAAVLRTLLLKEFTLTE